MSEHLLPSLRLGIFVFEIGIRENEVSVHTE